MRGDVIHLESRDPSLTDRTVSLHFNFSIFFVCFVFPFSVFPVGYNHFIYLLGFVKCDAVLPDRNQRPGVSRSASATGIHLAALIDNAGEPPKYGGMNQVISNGNGREKKRIRNKKRNQSTVRCRRR